MYIHGVSVHPRLALNLFCSIGRCVLSPFRVGDLQTRDTTPKVNSFSDAQIRIKQGTGRSLGIEIL